MLSRGGRNAAGASRDRFIAQKHFIGVPPRNYHTGVVPPRALLRAIIHKDKRTCILSGARA